MSVIKLVHTGGTIGSSLAENCRAQTVESLKSTGEFLIQKFKNSNSKFKNVDIKASTFNPLKTTLSESMTLQTLSEIYNHILSIIDKETAGIIVLHGTDTLAYTVSLFSFALANTPVPIIFVSGNRPPQDKRSNANANFLTAVRLICNGISPNVYVTYKNRKKMFIHLGSNILQCANFENDFKSATKKTSFEVKTRNIPLILKRCKAFSQKRKKIDIKIKAFADNVLLINGYTGLDYSIYKNALNDFKYKGVVHGTYHSGTLSFPGLVLKEASSVLKKSGNEKESNLLLEQSKKQSESVNSFKYLANACERKDIPLFIAPSKLGSEQYETMNVIANETKAVILNMTTESAYAKLIVALSCGMKKDRLLDYMTTSVNNEIIK